MQAQHVLADLSNPSDLPLSDLDQLSDMGLCANLLVEKEESVAHCLKNFPDIVGPTSDWFLQSFQRAFGDVPDYIAAGSFASTIYGSFTANTLGSPRPVMIWKDPTKPLLTPVKSLAMPS